MTDHTRPDDDFFPTPDVLCRVALEAHPHDPPATILDPGCGAGPWGRAAHALWPDAHIIGYELTQERIDTATAAGLLDAYDAVIPADYLSIADVQRYDMIIGNPPYKLAEAFVHKSLRLLAPGGVLMFLLRLGFMESQGRYRTMYSNGLRPSAVDVLVERPSFTGDGKTDATAYGLFTWGGIVQGPTRLNWLSWRGE